VYVCIVRMIMQQHFILENCPRGDKIGSVAKVGVKLPWIHNPSCFFFFKSGKQRFKAPLPPNGCIAQKSHTVKADFCHCHRVTSSLASAVHIINSMRITRTHHPSFSGHCLAIIHSILVDESLLADCVLLSGLQ